MKSTLHFLALGCALAVSATASLANTGRVDFAIGDVKAVGADGRSRPLAKGAEVASGETIDTGSGRAQLRFTDGAQVSLAPQTQFRIDDYKFAGQADGSEKGFFSLLKGALRTITGAVGRSNRDNYRVSTAVATIGIRGTEYSVAYGNSISVTTGEGIIEVCNAAGCLILNSGETARVPDGNTRPVMTDKKTEIPPPPAAPRPSFAMGDETDGEGNPIALAGLGSSSSSISYTVPLPSGSGGLGQVHVTNSGTAAGGLLGGAVNFGGSGELTSFIDGSTPANNLTSGTLAESGSDGIIGWGRWTSGMMGGSSPLITMSYVANVSANNVTATSIVRGYASFASTAPVVTSGGTVVATGTPNSVTGTLNVNFTNMTGGGTLSYVLNIPVLSQIFTINGSADQYSGAGFLGTASTITSSGSGCSPSCTGIIPWANAIQGFFTGSAAERAGANYMFQTGAAEKVSGAVVFK